MSPSPTRDAIRRMWANIAAHTTEDGPLPDRDLNELAAQDRTDLAAVERAHTLLDAIVARSGERPVLTGLRANLDTLVALLDDLTAAPPSA